MSFYFSNIYKFFYIINDSDIISSDNINMIIHTWFDEHDVDISRYESRVVTFLSYLFLECRSDRVLEVHKNDLERII